MLSLLLGLLLYNTANSSTNIQYAQFEDDLDSIAKRYLPVVVQKYGTRLQDYKIDLVKWNPHIKEWDKIKLSTPLYIDYPYPVHVSVDYAPVLKMGEENSGIDSKNSIFYTGSYGLFSETGTDEQKIESTQNSPISIGFAKSFRFNEGKSSIATSLYWSMLVASEVEGNVSNSNNKVESPSEWGGNLYYEQKIPHTSLSLYGGFDHENFSTYNTSDLVVGSSLAPRDNRLSYLSLGFTKFSQIYSFTLMTKVSFSQSILSKTSTGREADRFEGSRALLFLKIKDEKPFSYHLLYKRHMLKGPTKLSINRLGVGIGYDF